jgi:hypothetical protein
MRTRTGGAVRRPAPAIPAGWAPFRFAWLGWRRLAVTFNQHTAPLAISENAYPRLIDRARLPSFFVTSAATEFAA